MTTRILLADDHRIIREGLRTLLQGQPEMVVVAEAENGRRALELTLELRPDVVIMDVSLPDLTGVDATRQIAQSLPEVRVIALSMHSDRRYVSEMIKAGAVGYLLKDCAFEELTRAIRAVVQGNYYLCSEITKLVVRQDPGGSAGEDKSPFRLLSLREREVLQLLAEGRSTKEIAASLAVTVKTVETHRHNIMEKLQLGSIAELTKYAVREGLTTLE